MIEAAERFKNPVVTRQDYTAVVAGLFKKLRYKIRVDSGHVACDDECPRETRCSKPGVNAAERPASRINVDRLGYARQKKFLLRAARDYDVFKKPAPFAYRTFDQELAAYSQKALVAAETTAFAAGKDYRRGPQ